LGANTKFGANRVFGARKYCHNGGRPRPQEMPTLSPTGRDQRAPSRPIFAP